MRKYSVTASITLFVIFIAATSCKKDDNTCTAHPDAFRFSLVGADSGTDLLVTGEYEIDDIGIHYLYNDQQNQLIINVEENPAGDYTELFSAQLPMISLTRTETFYLRLSSQQTDTLVVVMGDEMLDGCRHHPYSLVTLNGVGLPLTGGDTFIIEK